MHREHRPHRRSVVASVVVLSLLTGCGAQQLPAPAAPTKELPSDIDLPLEPPAPGTSRVILDTADQKAKVVEITGAATASAGRYWATVIGTRTLCTTPCVVDLPYGSHPLVLRSVTDESRQSETELDVTARTKVFRHALGERKPAGAVRTVGATLIGVGALGAVTGALLWGVASASNAASSDTAPRSSLDSAGAMITGIGIAAVLIGIPLLVIDRPTERRGTTTEWSLPATDGGPSRPGVPAASGGTHL